MHPSGVNALSAWLVLTADASDGAVGGATDLPPRGLSALVLLANHPGSSVDWLHRRLGITQSGTVRLLDRLEALGLVWREKLPGRRETSLRLTAAGQQSLARGLAAREGALRAAIEPLDAVEQEQLVGLIGKALSGAPRRRAEADIACRLCDWEGCRPDCPVDTSVIDESESGR